MAFVQLQDVKSSKTTFINRTQQCFAVKSGVDGILDPDQPSAESLSRCMSLWTSIRQTLA